MVAKSKYKPEYVQQLLDYFGKESGTWHAVENKAGLVKYIRRPVELPLYQSFAREIGISHQTLLNWTHTRDQDGKLKHPEWAKAWNAVKGDQLRVLVENGLLGGYQTAFAIFTAKNILGWRDAVDIAHTDKTPGASRRITIDMTPQAAAEAYADTLGELETGGKVVPMRRRTG